MNVFRFRFCNDLANSNGYMFHTCQRQVEVHGVPTREQATELAKREFEQQEKVSSWRLRASSIECEELGHDTANRCAT